MGRLEKVREIYDLKFAELKSPENWRNTLKGISKYYKFNFVEAMLIHSQADNVTVMAEMKNWNKFGRYIKMGEHGIAVFTARTDTKLKYLFDIGQTQGKPIEKAWNIRESKQQRERLINRYNAKYGTDYTKASEVVKDIYSEVMESIKWDIEREIEVYKPENADTIKKFIADSALCLILSRCGFNIPDDKFDFTAVSEIIPDGMLVAAGNLSMKAAHEVLMEIENAIRRNDYEQQIQNQGHRLGVREEGRDILSQAGGTDRQGAAEHYGKESGGYAERNEPHSLGYGEHERTLRQDMGGDSGESDRQGDRSNGDHEEKSSDGAEGEGSEGNGDPNRSGAAGKRADDGIGDTAENSGNDPSPLVRRGSVAASVNDTKQNSNEESSENDDSLSFPDIPDNSAIVKIEWSESSELQDGEIFSFEEINRRLVALDDEQRINRGSEDWHSWYDKTKFTLYAKINGNEEIYTGRYDIGDGDGTLLHHIELCSGEEASELISFLKGLEQQAAEPQTLGEVNTEIIESVIESKEAEINTDGNQWFVTDKNDYRKILEPVPVEEGEVDLFNSHEEFLRSVSKNNPDYAEYINSHISELSKDIDDIEDMLSSEYREAEYEKLAVELGAGGGYGEDMANSSAEKRLAYLKESINLQKGLSLSVEENPDIHELPNALNRDTYSTDLQELINQCDNGLEKFYVDRENEIVTHIYFNPDSSAGGQLVYNYFSFDEFFKAKTKENPLEYLETFCRQELVDIDRPDFSAKARAFLENNEDFNSRDDNFDERLDREYAIYEFRKKTETQFNKIDEHTPTEIEKLVKEHINNVLYENKISAEIGEVVLIGSRSRGLETDTSDFDFVVEIKSDLKEDAIFNIINENPLEIGGVTVDINPICQEESGTLTDYLSSAEEYMQKKTRIEQANTAQENIEKRDKTEAAVESTDDYSDQDFHSKTVNIDVQNADGSYGENRDYYRIVTVGETGLKAYDNVVYSSREDAKKAILQNENLTEITYDDIVRKTFDKHIQSITLTAEERGEKAKFSETLIDSTAENSVEVVKNTPVNFHLSEGETIDYSKGEKAKFRDNVTAIRTLKEIEKGKRLATADEQQILSKYTGWGGLSKAFDKSAANWQKEYIELKALLSEEEYDAAFNSTLTAYYTDTELIRPIYRALERFGFKGGEVLDPAMGTGNFFSVIPSEMAQNSHLYGIELDKITGRIAKLLYPNADIKIQGFEYSNFEDGTFDVAVGNVPFENYRVSDNAYEDEYVLHDYFFIKTLDKLKPGGIAAFITSSGTLDKFNTSARIDIANRAELIGAVRLPGGKDGAFKAIAGTEATTDIIFLQKREHPESFVSYNMPTWAGSPISIYNKENHYSGTVNKYFSQHPEMILGEMKQVSGPHGYTAQCLPKEGTNLYEELEKALSTLQCEFTAKPTEITEESIEDIEEENRIIAADNAENYCFYVDESDTLYYRENEYMTLFETKSAKDEKAIKAMCGLCGYVKKVIDVQLTGCGEDQLKEAQKNLEQEYDKFVKNYGYLNKAENIRLFRTDMRSSLLLSLEQETDETENTGVYEKADIFTKATISPSKTVERADSPQEALAISLNLKNAVNIQYIASLCGETEEKVISDLGDLIYQNPQKYTGSPNSGWETAEEYLSGYVKDKLKTAMMFAEQYPELFERNVAALREHQPADIPISDIDFSVGAVYIPDDMYRDFIYETFETPTRCRVIGSLRFGSSIEVEYSSLLNQWKITNKSEGSNVKADQVYGTHRMNAYEIMECSLNQKRVTIKDPVEYRNQKGEKAIKYVVNIKDTQIARDRQTKIETAFKDWVLKDSKRVERIERIYNERFNNIVVRKYDGSHIKIPGLNPLIELRPHQLNAVARIASGNNVMLAHEVGAGKTAAMAAAGVYMRSIGAVKKPLYIVPKPIVAQWGREFARFFPLAKVLVTDEKDFEKKNRRKFLSKIATGDFDAVIMSHNQFEKIPLSLERQERIFNEKKMQLMEAKEKARASDGKKAFTVKQYASAIKALDKKLTKLRADFKKDSFITFEQLGCDYLFADEAHIYKNLYTATKHSNIAGINSNADSQRAFDMDMKASYLQEINDGGGITFATGTPISNSISECYVFQHFLQSPMLKKEGINSFDEWVSVFGNISLALEVKPTGNGWRMRERFSEFKNLPELCNMLSQCFDLVKTKDIKGISLPKTAGGKPETVVCEQSEDQAAQVAEGMERAQKIEEKKLSLKDDNMLAVCSFMSKVSLDPRINNPDAKDWDGLKVNECAKSIISIYKQHPDSAQVVFCDLSTPNNEGFNVYQALKDRLLKSGEFKPEEIAFVHDANNDKQRLKMFDKVNNAQIKVIIGSTSKLGTGVNMQKKLIAAHHLDAPYVPKDIEQRNGRIVRQGNENSEVIIRCYSTKGTFDSYRWQLLEKKQQLIAQVLSGKPPARSCKDIDETALTFAEMKAATADNPLIAEKMQVDNEVDRLKLLESDWISQQSRYKLDFEKYFPSIIQKQNDLIEKLDQDLKLLEENPIPKNSFVMKVNGVSYAERTEAGNALVVEYNKYLGTDEWRNSESSKSVGNFRGFDISFYYTTQSSTVRITGASGFIYESDFTLSAVGTCIKIENLVGGISGRKQAALSGIKEAEKGIEAAKGQYGKPFEYADELNNLLLKQADINSKLEFGQEQEEIIDDEWEGDETEV